MGNNTSILANRHYYFHIEYYKDLVYDRKNKEFSINGKDKLQERNKAMVAEFTEYDQIQQEQRKQRQIKSLPQLQSFVLKTQYPGLLAGIGELHSGGFEGEIMAGFSLDYVTGLPIIPGSSIKGMLRSAFDLGNGTVIRSILGKLCECSIEKLSIGRLVTAIFDPCQVQSEIKNKDSFFDAVVTIKTNNSNGKARNRKLLGLEAITPHRQTDLLELVNPVPLTFLKVMPEVEFEFRFLLYDTDIVTESGEKITTLEGKQKLALFKELLCIFGIGAKTNVGYGILN